MAADRDGHIWKMDDVGMTFHVVSDLHGQVDHLDLVAKRLLQLDQFDFPAGIRMSGHYENHLNWDVVKIFRVAWPSMDEQTRQLARAEISDMLNWCLTNSLQADGSAVQDQRIGRHAGGRLQLRKSPVERNRLLRTQETILDPPGVSQPKPSARR